VSQIKMRRGKPQLNHDQQHRLPGSTIGGKVREIRISLRCIGSVSILPQHEGYLDIALVLEHRDSPITGAFCTLRSRWLLDIVTLHVVLLRRIRRDFGLAGSLGPNPRFGLALELPERLITFDECLQHLPDQITLRDFGVVSILVEQTIQAEVVGESVRQTRLNDARRIQVEWLQRNHWMPLEMMNNRSRLPTARNPVGIMWCSECNKVLAALGMLAERHITGCATYRVVVT